MKVTKIKDLKSLFEAHFKQHIESVNRSRRGEDMSGDYYDEHDGPGSAYEPSIKKEGVNRSRRSGDSENDYSDEDEGKGVSYDESAEVAFEAFVRDLDETNLYHDSDTRKRRDVTVPDEEDAVSHAAPEGHGDRFPGPPQGMASEARTPDLTDVYEEGFYGLEEGMPPWLKDKGDDEDGDDEKDDLDEGMPPWLKDKDKDDSDDEEGGEKKENPFAKKEDCK